MQVQAFHPDNEILGRAIMGIADAVHSDDFLPIFEKHGLVNVDPQRWYREQQFLDVLNDIASQGDAMYDFVSIGMNMISNAAFPPEYASLPFEKIISDGKTFALNTRGPQPNTMTIDVLGPKHVVRRFRIPGFDDYWYGVVYGYAKRFVPKGTTFKVYYDPNSVRHDLGGEETAIHIEWA